MEKPKYTNEQLKNVVADFVRLIKANAMGAQVIGHFPINDLKKGTAKNRTEAYNRFFNVETGEWRVSKVTTYKNITFQRSYLNAVENRSENPMPYQVEAPKGREWVEGCEGILLIGTSDPSKLYLRISENKNTKRETSYFVDNRPATEEEIAIIKEFSPKKNYTCQKQVNYGVSEENQVIVKDLTLVNIVQIKFGEKILNLR